MVLGNWVQVALLEEEGWARRPPEIPSNLTNSVILCNLQMKLQPRTDAEVNQFLLIGGTYLNIRMSQHYRCNW